MNHASNSVLVIAEHKCQSHHSADKSKTDQVEESHKTLLFGHMFLWPDQNQVQGAGFYQQHNLWLGTVWFGLGFI